METILKQTAIEQSVKEQSVIEQSVTGRSVSILESTRGIISLLALLFVAALAVYQVKAPDTVPASAPAIAFSSERAMRHLQMVAQRPHPAGTAAIVRVRNYILQELSALGLTAEVQKTTVVKGDAKSSLSAGAINNIVARLPGSRDSRAVLLVSHYDTVPTAKGASDDGAGVAALLETARALKAGPPPKSSVLFLFTDCEEAGFLGAKAFVEEHSWAKDVAVFLNFEARGSSGPSIMFETSDDNGWLIEELAKAAPAPFANSASYDIYKLMPNETDFSVLKRAGLSGLNFAYIEGAPDYHTLRDGLDSIDERSLQHHGSYALALARHFADLDLGEIKRANAVYFNIVGSTFVHYSGHFRFLFVGITLLLFAATVVMGLRKRLLTLRPITFAALAGLMSVILSAVLISACWWLIRKLTAENRLVGETYNSFFYRIGFVALTIAIVSFVYAWLHKRIRLPNLMVGTTLGWILLMVAVNLYLPGLSYLFTWPLLFVAAGTAYLFLTGGEPNASTKSLVVMSLCAVPAVILFSQMIYLLFVAMMIGSAWIPAAMVALVLGLLIVPLNTTFTRSKWLVPSISLAVGLSFIAAANFASKPSSSRPKRDTILYAMDGDAGKAVWATSDPGVDEWTSQFFPAGVERGQLNEYIPSRFPVQFLTGVAPVAPITAPHVTVVEDQQNAGIRTLRLRITSTRQAPLLSVYLPNGVEVVNALVDGKQDNSGNQAARSSSGRAWSLHYLAPSQDGVDLMLQIRSLEPVKLRVVDRSYELPQISGQSFTERPSYIIPSPLSDLSMVSKSFTF